MMFGSLVLAVAGENVAYTVHARINEDSKKHIFAYTLLKI
jgi:hypothetical protein